mgnify:CR=1 FL=1
MTEILNEKKEKGKDLAKNLFGTGLKLLAAKSAKSAFSGGLVAA